MLMFFLLVTFFISGALGTMYFWIGVPKIYSEPLPPIKQFHLYVNPKQPIDKITVAAFYFVPKNKTGAAVENWRMSLSHALERLQQFHTFQFGGRSSIALEIYPEPIIGVEENLIYDSDVTQHGNPEALRRVAQELEGRVFKGSGDLYRPEFAKGGDEIYRVWFIMYEGVGASGSGNVALVSRKFLTDQEYSDIGVSVAAHEFYHTLGIPDAYEIESAIPLGEDIMGLGRGRPIEKTYISRDTLKKMGL